jgi:hypothetical protein
MTILPKLAGPLWIGVTANHVFGLKSVPAAPSGSPRDCPSRIDLERDRRGSSASKTRLLVAVGRRSCTARPAPRVARCWNAPEALT